MGQNSKIRSFLFKPYLQVFLNTDIMSNVARRAFSVSSLTLCISSVLLLKSDMSCKYELCFLKFLSFFKICVFSFVKFSVLIQSLFFWVFYRPKKWTRSGILKKKSCCKIIITPVPRLRPDLCECVTSMIFSRATCFFAWRAWQGGPQLKILLWFLVFKKSFFSLKHHGELWSTGKSLV